MIRISKPWLEKYLEFTDTACFSPVYINPLVGEVVGKVFFYTKEDGIMLWKVTKDVNETHSGEEEFAEISEDTKFDLFSDQDTAIFVLLRGVCHTAFGMDYDD